MVQKHVIMWVKLAVMLIVLLLMDINVVNLFKDHLLHVIFFVEMDILMVQKDVIMLV